MAYSTEKQSVQVYYPRTDGSELKLFVGEARYAKFIDLCDLHWIHNIKSFEVGGNMRYIPDFYIEEMNLYIEVKNRNPDSVPPTDYEKMRRFYESGHSLYLVRRPCSERNYIIDDYNDSLQQYYSSRYIIGEGLVPKCLIFQRDWDNKVKLMHIDRYYGFTLMREIEEANRTKFERCDGEGWI